MKRRIPKGLAALFIVFQIGIVMVSCGPIFDVDDDYNGGNNGGGEPPPGPPADDYESVIAYDWMDLEYYLISEDTSYAITLETEDSDIYLQRNLSIVKPMRIIGSPENVITIHSINREGGNTFYCLDLQADLELLYCGFTGYNGTSRAADGIAAGSPPINIRAGITLTMGKDSVLELDGSFNPITSPRTGSQVKLGDGVGFVDGSASGDLLFKAGVEKLIVNGKVSLENNLTLGSGVVLQIENGGELRVGPGATLTLDNGIKELILEGDIVVDRTASSGGSLVFTDGLAVDSLLGKITGEKGFLVIENGETGSTAPFEYGVNTIIRLNSNGINMQKRAISDMGGEIRLTGTLTIPKGKKLFVGVGVTFNVYEKLTLNGGVLDVRGIVNIDTDTDVPSTGSIIIEAEDLFTATPKGSVAIGSTGSVTVDNGGTFKDKSVSWDDAEKNITFPSYGDGSLIIKYSNAAAGSGVLAIANKNLVSASVSDLLVFTQAGTTTSFTINSGPKFTLTGNAALNVPASDFSLEGAFTVAGGAELTIDGNLTVSASDTLVGSNTSTGTAAPKLNPRGTVIIYSSANETPATITGRREWMQKNDQWGWY